MVLDIRRALHAGYDGLTSTDGLNVASVLLVLNLYYGTVAASFQQQLATTVFEPGPGGRPPITIRPPVDLKVLALDLPVALLAVLVLVGVVGNEVLRFWGIRLFAEAGGESLGERLPVLLAAAGGVALLLFALRGLLPLLWVSGDTSTFVFASQLLGVAALAVTVATVYLRQAVALTDARVGGVARDAFQSLRAAPLATLGVLAVVAVLRALAGISTPLAIIAGFGGQSGVLPWVQLGSLALVAVVDTFAIAAVTDAYLQVRGASDAA